MKQPKEDGIKSRPKIVTNHMETLGREWCEKFAPSRICLSIPVSTRRGLGLFARSLDDNLGYERWSDCNVERNKL